MSKELEVFRKISVALETSKSILEDIYVSDLSQIKPVLRPINNAIKSIPLIETALKALEIIKEKSVDVGFLQYSSSVDLYNHYIVEHAWTKHTKILTPEEYRRIGYRLRKKGGK